MNGAGKWYVGKGIRMLRFFCTVHVEIRVQELLHSFLFLEAYMRENRTLRVVAFKEYSTDTRSRGKVLLAATVTLRKVRVILLPSAYICLTLVRLFVAALARRAV